MLRFTFLLALYFFSLTAFSQNVTGTITDEQAEPLSGVAIQLVDKESGTVTDRSGQYNLALPGPGTFQLRYSYVGFDTLYQEITVSGERTYVRDVSLQPAINALEAITVEGIRAGAKDPIAQTTLEREGIEQVFSGQDAQFLLSQSMPSIVTHTEAGTGFSNYGGMRLRGIDQTRVNITLNGVPLNDMLDQGVFFSNLPDFANSMQSIQVQRGVGTSTNGTASYAGSINFQSTQLQQTESGAEVQLGAGSFNTYRASGTFNTGLTKDGFALQGRFTNFTTDGYRYHSGSDAWSMFLSGGYFGEKDLLKFTFLNGRTASQLAYFPVPEPLIEQDPRTNLNYPQDRDNFGQQLAQLEYTHLFSPDWSVTVSPYVGGAGGDFPFGYDSTFGNTGPLAGQINYPLTNFHAGAFAHTTYQGDKWQLKGGLHAYQFDRNNWETNLPDNTTRIYNDSSRKQEISAFVKAQYSLGSFTFFGDLQWRNVAMDFFPDYRFIGETASIPTYNYQFLNPTVGVTFEINNNWQAYASFGRSGREPTKFDLFGGSTRVDSLNLLALQDVNTVQPEFVNDLEAGVRWQTRNFRGQANFFWMDFENEIAPIGERLVFVQLRTNVPNSYRRGLELEATWQPVDYFELGGFVTLMDAAIDEYAPQNDDTDTIYRDVRPVLTPAVLGQLTATYTLKDKLRISLTGRYTGEMFIEPTNQPDLVVPASFVLDGQIHWQFWKEHEAILQLNNLLNQRYYTYGEVGSFAGETVPAFFVQPPRNVNLLLRLRF